MRAPRRVGVRGLRRALQLSAAVLLAATTYAQTKAPLTIDDLFSSVEIRSAKLASDGNAAVIQTTRADWEHNRFRDDLWLWREGREGLLPLTQSGHDSDPEWSPDGKYVAFISGRALPSESSESAPAAKSDEDPETGRVWVVDVNGGEAFPLYVEALRVHSFAWKPDSSAILFSVIEPLSKSAEEAERREWKDTSRWRLQDRGDVLLEISLKDAIPAPAPLPISETRKAEEERKAEQPQKSTAKPESEEAHTLPEHARILSRSKYAISEIAPAPSGGQIAFLTNSISGREEHPDEYEIYLLSGNAETETAAHQLTHNQALERQVHWDKNGSELYFGVFAASGSLEGPYRDVQGRLYSVNVATGKVRRYAEAFGGNWTDYALSGDGKLLGLGQTGTETQMYSMDEAAFLNEPKTQAFDEPQPAKLSGQAGSYEGLETADHTNRVLFRHSGIDKPTEVYIATDAAHLSSARQITNVNALFTQRELPQWKTYRWKADDGVTIEGVLLYPPGKLGQKHLRMFTLIHGGPADADGNRFGANWYSWASLAAANGWLVFQPNYRGSSGYGDEFMLAISPHIVSRPGKDILEGVDALIKDGTADPDHLAVGGYSYGGYMTNWLITQTTRFRSAVSGAGAVEHAANWGNDDETYDDAWYLGGTPWRKPAIYQSEAALFQFDKVRTPVHDVMGSDDIRVAALEGYLMERALDSLGITHRLLIFPGEGHGLGKNPWHGYIKVREELKWLEKFDETPRLDDPRAALNR